MTNDQPANDLTIPLGAIAQPVADDDDDLAQV